jgi:hypothetical protein
MYECQANFATLVNGQLKARKKLYLSYGLRCALAVTSYMFKLAKQNHVKLHKIKFPQRNSVCDINFIF